MISKLLSKKNDKLLQSAALILLLVAIVLGTTMCTSAEAPEEVSGETPAEAPEETMTEDVAETPTEETDVATLAIEHFSVIEGTTWSGAHDRAGKRLAEKYPNVEYVFREEVGPDLAVPYAEELIF